jgi:hypothetical protein
MLFLVQALNSSSTHTMLCGRPAVQVVLIAVAYIATYGTCTTIILTGLLEVALAGGFTEFTVQFPVSTFISTVISTMALANSYFKRALLADIRRHTMASQLLESVEVPPETSGAPQEDEPSLMDTANSLNESSCGTRCAMKQVVVCICTSLGRARQVRSWASCLKQVPGWRWLCEKDESDDPLKYGRRLPLRRVQLALGTGLTAYVLFQEYLHNEFENLFLLLTYIYVYSLIPKYNRYHSLSPVSPLA